MELTEFVDALTLWVREQVSSWSAPEAVRGAEVRPYQRHDNVGLVVEVVADARRVRTDDYGVFQCWLYDARVLVRGQGSETEPERLERDLTAAGSFLQTAMIAQPKVGFPGDWVGVEAGSVELEVSDVWSEPDRLTSQEVAVSLTVAGSHWRG